MMSYSDIIILAIVVAAVWYAVSPIFLGAKECVARECDVSDCKKGDLEV